MPDLIAAAPAAPPAAESRAPTSAPPVREPAEQFRPAPPTRLVGPSFDAAYLNNPRPGYPAVARRMGLTGEVRLRVTVDKAGHPERVTLHASSGSDVLDRAALDAVRGWRFVPARRGDEPLAADVVVPIRFELE